MPKAEMTGRERLLATIGHEEPDRVPISPRYSAWLISEYGAVPLEQQLEMLPDLDFMHILGESTPNYVVGLPDEYPLTEVTVDQRREPEGDCEMVHRTFHTPAGDISDITRVTGLSNLTWLRLGNNQISDITPVAGMVSLEWLLLSNNQISDITPLLANVGLGGGR